MDVVDVGEIIALRQLYYFDDTHEQRMVRVIIGKPQASPDSPEFLCPFQLVGIGSGRPQTAKGRDSMQALQSALILVAALLNHLNDKLGRKLIWEGAVKGDLGFP
jgi:hypothetical protein